MEILEASAAAVAKNESSPSLLNPSSSPHEQRSARKNLKYRAKKKKKADSTIPGRKKPTETFPKSARKPKKTPSQKSRKVSSNTTGKSLMLRQPLFSKRDDSEEEPRSTAPVATSPDRVVLKLNLNDSTKKGTRRTIPRKKRKLKVAKSKQRAEWDRDTRLNIPSYRRIITAKQVRTRRNNNRTLPSKKNSKHGYGGKRTHNTPNRPITTSTVNSWRTSPKSIKLMRPGELRKFELAERRAYQKARLKERAEESSYVPRTHASLDSILRAHCGDLIAELSSMPAAKKGEYVDSSINVSSSSPQNMSMSEEDVTKLDDELAAQKNNEEKENEKRILQSIVHNVLPRHYGNNLLSSRHSYVKSSLHKKGGCIMYSHPAEYTAPVQYSKQASMIYNTYNVVEPMTPPRKRTHPLVDRYMTVIGGAKTTSPPQHKFIGGSRSMNESIGTISLVSSINMTTDDGQKSQISPLDMNKNEEKNAVEGELKSPGLKIEQLSPVGDQPKVNNGPRFSTTTNSNVSFLDPDDGAVMKLKLEIETLDRKLQKLRR